MKHRTCPLRAALAAALVLVMLCVPALAAEIAVDYTSEYRFTAAAFLIPTDWRASTFPPSLPRIRQSFASAAA